MKFVIFTILAYLLGSIPFGLIIAKARGKDLRKTGSGNIGATNVTRTLGKKWGYFCFMLDVGKGLIPTLVATAHLSNPPGLAELCGALAVGVAAVLGHIFPIYIGFRGGKGVATSFGVGLGLWPYYTISSVISLSIWTVTLMIWRYVSLSSILASLAFPVALVGTIIFVSGWHFENLWPLLIVAAIIPLMVILRHQGNIKRLIAGTEMKAFTKNPQN